MRKKLYSMILIMLSCFLIVLTGCGSSSQSDSGGKVTLNYMIWDKVQAVTYKKIAKDFEKKNPNIKINFTIVPFAQYWTKLQTSLTGNSGPDVFWMNIPNAYDYINGKQLAKLDLSEMGLKASNYPNIEAFTSNQSVYGIPKDYDATALYYNKKLFDEAKVSYPDGSWTWQDWENAAKKLTNKSKGIYGMANPLSWQGGYYEVIYANGGTPFLKNGKSGFGQKATIDAMKFWYSFSEKGYAPSIKQMTDSTQAESMLLSNKVAMMIDGSWIASTLLTDKENGKNIAVAPIPKGKVRASTTNSLANSINAKSAHIKEAQKWVAYVSSKEPMEQIAKSGTAIPSYKETQSAWTKQYREDQHAEVFPKAVNYAVHLPGNKNAMKAINLETDEFKQVWNGKETITQACKNLVKKANQAMGY